jgi:UDP-GlcNAc:undecaprenyl-phosphate GlcNAc-1-phosphate transferase
MSFNIMKWFDSSVLIFMGMSFALNALIAYIWRKKIYQKLGIRAYRAAQRIHLNETPRLGGAIFLLSLISFVAYSKTTESIELVKIILISLIPIIIVALKEDLFHNVKPITRLLALFFVGWLFKTQFIGPLPNMTDIPLVSKLLMVQGGVTIFYILCMTTVANGMNLIDGVNGLCAAVTISILSSLLFLSYKTGDVIILSAIFSIILIFTPFIIFNYPYGEIFLGDLGAYSLGIIVSIFTIIFFGRHPEISPWAAVLILIYPVTELIFSIIRRLINRTSVHHADTKHLHLKLFYLFRPQIAYKKIANMLVTAVLTPLWLFALVMISWTYQNLFYILIAIGLFVMMYSLLYIVLPSAEKVTKTKRTSKL